MRIVVTGASAGIGAALAARLRHCGHAVWGLARTFGAATGSGAEDSPLQSKLTADQPAARESSVDVAAWSEVQGAADEVRREWGQIDGLVCCAAIQGVAGKALEADAAEWARTVQIDLLGTFNAIRAFAQLLRPLEGRRSKIVCFSGGGATKARPNFSAYGVAKTGVVRLVETIAAEEGDRPLDINAVAPGAINTRLTDEVIAQGPKAVGEAEYAAALKQKQNGGSSMDRALDLVEWLLSPDSDRITGRLISAPWDPWDKLQSLRPRLETPGDELYTLRRNTR